MGFMAKREAVILSLGGSMIVPNDVNSKFLHKFRQLVLKHVKKGKRFILITGGGRTARKYIKGANSITKLTHDEMDWLGIYCTHLNAQLVRMIFKKEAYPVIITNPNKKLRLDKKHHVLIAAGWKPGCSTDTDAVLLAKNFKVKTVINLSNIDYAYDKDPNKFKNAKKVKKINWKGFRKIVGNKWIPGLSMPFDPIASKIAQKLKLNVIITNGNDLKNLDKILSGKKKFKGTVIEG